MSDRMEQYIRGFEGRIAVTMDEARKFDETSRCYDISDAEWPAIRDAFVKRAGEAPFNAYFATHHICAAALRGDVPYAD